ncbi:MAG: GNAT family N-acetyltransferase [Hyphomicrobium sp.]
MERCSDTRVRAAEKADIVRVAAIYADAVINGTGTFEIDPPATGEMLRRFDELTSGGFPFLVSEIAGEFTGFAYAGPFRARAAFKTTVEVSIYVAAEARREGTGGLLLEALIEESARRGFREMLALIGDSENVASIALHRSCGFTEAGLLRNVGFKHDRWLDVVVMQRSLYAPGT